MAETLDLCYKSFNDTFELISQKLEFYKFLVNHKTNKISAALDQLRIKYEKFLIIQLKKYIYYFKFEYAINQAQSGSISCFYTLPVALYYLINKTVYHRCKNTRSVLETIKCRFLTSN